jgi:alkanesulfonate monooxygenase SsuD/methylene tetrahydromethanopterin reductase-like flavin-dependent oxidoreductase (luciferase family)
LVSSIIKECGLLLEPQLGWSTNQIVEWAKYAEKSGYGYVFRSDHLLPTSGNMQVSSPECWTTLAIISASTKKIKFGPMVSPIGFRNPAVLARMACTLGRFSSSRLVLGLGSGWYQEEYEAHGISFPKLSTRIDELSEALKIIRPITSGDTVSFKGEHFAANVGDYGPRLQGKINLLLGGRHDEIVRLAIDYADELNIFAATPYRYRRIRDTLNGKVTLSWTGPYLICKSEQELQRKGRELADVRERKSSDVRRMLEENGVIFGTSKDEFIECLSKFKRSGVQRFYFQVTDPKDKRKVDTLTTTFASQCA